jgi:hypothetical protein
MYSIHPEKNFTENMDIGIHMDLCMDLYKDMCMHMDTHKDIHYTRMVGHNNMVGDNHRHPVFFGNYPPHYSHRCNCFCLLRHLTQHIRSKFHTNGYREMDKIRNTLYKPFILYIYKKCFPKDFMKP